TAYQKSKFITHASAEYVDFALPSRAAVMYFFFGPRSYMRRVHLNWIGRHISREHAVWMGELLGRLSQNQIHDAFRAAGYNPQEVEGFSAVVEQRIAALKAL